MDFLDWLRAHLPSSVVKIFSGTKEVTEQLEKDAALIVPLRDTWGISLDLSRSLILLYRLAEREKVRFKIVEGFRSCTEQNRRFSVGDSKARCGQSAHNPCGVESREEKCPALAVDFETIPASSASRAKVGQLAKSVGLEWGGGLDGIPGPVAPSSPELERKAGELVKATGGVIVREDPWFRPGGSDVGSPIVSLPDPALLGDGGGNGT